MPHMPYFGDGWGILMLIGMILFWGLLIVGLVLLVRYIAAQTPSARPVSGPETSIDILNRRLAAGEISTDEYEGVRRRIEGENR